VTTALIVCIGNDLVADDGAGQAVHASLEAISLAAGTRLVFLGLGGIDLLEVMNGEDLLVVIDAVQLGAAPGIRSCPRLAGHSRAGAAAGERPRDRHSGGDRGRTPPLP